MLLIFDNYDSFTFNLCDYFRQLGQDLMVVRNDEKSLAEIETLQFSAIVISPGPGVPEHSGILLPLIKRWHNRVPILGICLGHQAIGTFFGLSLAKAPYPMHGKVSTLITSRHPMFNNLPHEFEVCRYHSLSLISDDLAQKNQEEDFHSENLFEFNNENFNKLNLIATAFSKDDNCLMALAHKTLPIWGIQFHPEAILSQYGLELLDNWLKSFNLHKQ